MKSTTLLAQTQPPTHVPGTPTPYLPPVPVLPSTLLGLDLLRQRPAFDLASAAHLLQADPGALLHLFRLVAEEFPDATERPTRLGDCIASLPSILLFKTLSSARELHLGRREQHARFTRFATHATAVAHSARTVAETLGLSGEQAFLVGLLHELGSLPLVLDGPVVNHPAPAILCEQLSLHYGLPPALRSALDDVHRDRTSSVWTAVLAAAHDLLRPS